METLKYAWEDKVLRIIALSIVSLIIIALIILLIIHLIKISKGEHSKFLCFESNATEISNQTKDSQTIKGKNINTGSNYGKIGDN